MTEYNIFCFSGAYDNNESFQQNRYRAFNKDVGEKRYYEVKLEVSRILDTNREQGLTFSNFWKSVTVEQWRKLLDIPEAKDFKEGFEYISGVKINLDAKVKVVCGGKTVEISRDSAKALNLI